MESSAPRKSLQIGQCHAIAHGTVLIGIAGQSVSGLRVDYLENRGFAVFVTQRDKPQALRGKPGGAVETTEFVQRRFSFRI